MALEIKVAETFQAKTDASSYKVNADFAKELEEDLMKFTTDYEYYQEDAPLVEQTTEVDRNADVELNITEHTESGGNKLVEPECMDTTESSSSFDGSDSEVEDVGSSGDSDPLSGYDVLDGLFWIRKKPLTTHWRSFIQPLMWRCKWVELQIKKLEEKGQEYDRKLQECSPEMQVQLEGSTVVDLGVKSLPFSANHGRSKVLRRKKRRRYEETMSIAAYQLDHNLFSYYEDRKRLTKVAPMDYKVKDPAIASQRCNIDDEFQDHDGLLHHETEHGDTVFENILRKIGTLQSKVGEMKSRVYKLTSENARGFSFSCTDNLSLPVPTDAWMGSGESNEEKMQIGTYISQLMSEYNAGDLLFPKGAVACPEEVDADGNRGRNRVRFAGPFGNEEDEVLIDNWVVKEEMDVLQDVIAQPNRRPSTMNINPQAANNQQPHAMRSVSEHTAPKNKMKNEAEEMDGVQGVITQPTRRPLAGNANPRATNNQLPHSMPSVSKHTTPKSKTKNGRTKAGRQ